MIQTDSGPGVRHVVCRVMVCNVIMSTQYHAQCPPDHQPADYHQLLIVQCINAGVSRSLQYPLDFSGVCVSASRPGYQLGITVHGASVFILWYLAEASLSCSVVAVCTTDSTGCLLSLFR